MITFDNHCRSSQKEIMDDLDFHGEEMQNLLGDLKAVNKWLGGNSINIHALKKLLQHHPKENELTILDIGCGDGQMLRTCADFLKVNGFKAKCIGIDFNANILELARSESKIYPNIEFIKIDVLADQNLIPNCDIAMFTLFLHHLSNQEIQSLLSFMLKKTKLALIINDLHRHKWAFNLFRLVSVLFLRTKTAGHDGLVSIARGFKKSELQVIAGNIPGQSSEIRWQWAFRYKWLLKVN